MLKNITVERLRDKQTFSIIHPNLEMEERKWEMAGKYRFLLIGTSKEDPWCQTIEKVSATLGSLQSVSEVGTGVEYQDKYNIIIIDAANIENVPRQISTIKRYNPEAKILVATASPTWKRAREAYRAGAVSYFRKSINQAETRSELLSVIAKLAPQDNNEVVFGSELEE